MTLLESLKPYGKSIVFRPFLVNVTGSINSAIMLSQAIYWHSKSKEPIQWFYKTQKEWQNETGLTRYEQENARKLLRQKNILEEKRQGNPAKIHYRINKENLIKTLDCCFSANKSAADHQTTMQQTNSLDCNKPTIKNAANQQTIYKETKSTTKNTTKSTYIDSCAKSDDLHANTQRKKSKTEILQYRFTEFWQAYPKKRSKGQALKTWMKLKPSEQLKNEMLEALRRATTSVDWRKQNGQFIPNPSTWLNAMGWEDELDHNTIQPLEDNREPTNAEKRSEIRRQLYDVNDTSWADGIDIEQYRKRSG